MECCGQERDSRYCPDCGAKLGQLTVKELGVNRARKYKEEAIMYIASFDRNHRTPRNASLAVDQASDELRQHIANHGQIEADGEIFDLDKDGEITFREIPTERVSNEQRDRSGHWCSGRSSRSGNG